MWLNCLSKSCFGFGQWFVPCFFGGHDMECSWPASPGALHARHPTGAQTIAQNQNTHCLSKQSQILRINNIIIKNAVAQYIYIYNNLQL